MRTRLALLATGASLLACAPTRTITPGPHLDRKARPESATYRGHTLALPTGLRVVALELAGAPSTSVLVAFGLAGLEEPAGKEGLRELTASVANRGAIARGGFRAMERLFAVGAGFDHFVNPDELAFSPGSGRRD
jgi:hypothetical protein